MAKNKKNKVGNKVKKVKTYEVKLTKNELVHIRDLFSVVMPPDTKKTLSQQLAELEDRVYVEDKLWAKLAEVCKEASVPVDSEAPDYIVVPTSPPPMGIFQLSPEETAEEDDSDERGFLSQKDASSTDISQHDEDDEEEDSEEDDDDDEDEDQ